MTISAIIPVVLLGALQVCKSCVATGTLPGTWVVRNHTTVEQIMDPNRLKALMNVKSGDWTAVAKELDSETKSELGKFLFGDSLHSVAKERADNRALADAINMLSKTDKLDMTIFQAYLAETSSNVENFPGSDTIPERRKVSDVKWKYTC